MTVSIQDIEAAAERLRGVAMHTPLLPVTLPSGGRVFVKAECLQPMGAFKLRGAYNHMALIPDEVRVRGVVACSSGNHAQGVALAARLFHVSATIVMPHDSPAVKVQRTRELGATVVGYDRRTEDREAIAKTISDQSGATFIHPYDDAAVVAGQGTAGLEIIQDLAALGLTPTRVLVPVSGGGLAGGIARAITHYAPKAEIITVEPNGFDDMARSLTEGERQRNEHLDGSIADALLAAMPGRIGFGILHELGARGVSVSDEHMLDAMAYLLRHARIVTEPGGAISFAALLAGQVESQGVTVAIASGGNVDDTILARALSR